MVSCIIPLHSHVGTIRLIQLTYFACVLPPTTESSRPKNCTPCQNPSLLLLYLRCWNLLITSLPASSTVCRTEAFGYSVRVFTPICDITGVCGAHAMLQVVFLPRINCTWVSSVVLCSTLAAPSRFLHDSCAMFVWYSFLFCGGEVLFQPHPMTSGFEPREV